MEQAAEGDRAHRVRSIGETLGETAEVLGRVESRMAETMGALVGESTRALGSAAARTATELRQDAIGGLIDDAATATARTVEATGRLVGAVLDAGGTYAREVADAATQAAATGLERRREQGGGADPHPSPTFVGPS